MQLMMKFLLRHKSLLACIRFNYFVCLRHVYKLSVVILACH